MKALTAHTMAADRDRCLAAAMDAFVAKPLRPVTLLAAIDTLVPPGAAAGATAVPAPPSAPSSRAEADERVDLASLLDAFGHDRPLIDETIAVFLADLPALRAALAAAVAAGEAGAIARAAHSLKGAVGLFSTGAAYQAARALEEEARAGVVTGAASHSDTLARWRVLPRLCGPCGANPARPRRSAACRFASRNAARPAHGSGRRAVARSTSDTLASTFDTSKSSCVLASVQFFASAASVTPGRLMAA